MHRTIDCQRRHRLQRAKNLVLSQVVSDWMCMSEFDRKMHGGIIRKELPQHSFTVVVSEPSTPPTSNS